MGKREEGTSDEARGAPLLSSKPAVLFFVKNFVVVFASAFFFIYFFSLALSSERKRTREGYRLLSSSARQENPISA